MPESPLEVVAWWADEARSATGNRDSAVRDAIVAGHSLREVAEAAGLSHAAIARIRDR